MRAFVYLLLGIAIVAAAASPPPDLDWDDMAIDDPDALDPGAWAAA